MRDAGFDELEFYSADSAVIHIRWCHTMGACFSVCHGYIAYAVDREAIIEATVVAQNTAMAMGGVFAEADVGNDEEGREASAKETDGLNDWALGVVRCGTESVLNVWQNWDTKEDDGPEAFPYERVEVRNKFIDAAAVLVGKGGNEGLFFSLVRYEERVYEH